MSLAQVQSDCSRGRSDVDSGFTLIELLVVIIIIGILAAIAIPLFLNQRIKAYDSAAKSDLRELAQFEEAYLVDHSSYATIATLLADGEGVKVSPGVTLSVVRYNGPDAYCLSAKSAGSPNTWFYDSQAGGQQGQGASGCPKTTTGTVGDSVTG